MKKAYLDCQIEYNQYHKSPTIGCTLYYDETMCYGVACKIIEIPALINNLKLGIDVIYMECCGFANSIKDVLEYSGFVVIPLNKKMMKTL